MANAAAIELHASAAQGLGSGTGSAVDLGETRSCVRLALVVTAVSGTTPTLDVTVETAPSETGPWRDGVALAQMTAAGKSERTIAGLDRWVRASWAVGGTDTPSFTFSLDGEAHTLYAQPADLSRTAINATAISGIAADVLADCCLRATADAETAIGSSNELPLVSWGEDLRGHVAARAVFYGMSSRGFKPGTGLDSLILMNGGCYYEGRPSAAEKYFSDVASGRLKPFAIVDQTQDDFEGAGTVVSGSPRRW